MRMRMEKLKKYLRNRKFPNQNKLFFQRGFVKYSNCKKPLERLELEEFRMKNNLSLYFIKLNIEIAFFIVAYNKSVIFICYIYNH